MCGIAGFCNLHREKDEQMKTIRRMTDRLKERGPDAEGAESWLFGRGTAGHDITFGHRRLSIIDLTESGAQPMTSHSGRFSIAYNGEIYNHKELREELTASGKVPAGDWRGTSDTESLLEACEAWGVARALKKCRGMFAIALYDHESGRITLARDRVGEKPLFYGFAGPVFCFASDISCFKDLPDFPAEINRGILTSYFIHGYIPAPHTIYRNVWKLLPGTILTVDAPYAPFDPVPELDVLMKERYSAGGETDADGHRFQVYWSMREAARRGEKDPFTGSFAEAADQLEELLTASVRRQMVADVPLGAFLSAGIDSSTIVALMQKIAAADGASRVRTFTIGMKEKGFNEAPAAAEIAAHLGTEHTEKIITKEDALAVIPKLARMFGEPFADSSQIPTFLVSAMTREHVTVSLSGDGGDELFCGYTSYASIDRIWGKMKGYPAALRRFVGKTAQRLPLQNPILKTKARLLTAEGPIGLHLLESDHDPIIDEIVAAWDKKELPYALNQLKEGILSECNRQVMLADLLLYHPDDILVKVDRCAMANSLETRVPMLDQDVVEFAFRLPIDYLLEYTTDAAGQKVRTGKRVLREVLYRHIPREMMDRPKKGFGIPIEEWILEDSLRSWAERLLSPDRIRSEGILNADTVERIWKDYTERGIWRVQIWYLLMFEEWMDRQTGAQSIC
ncbi:MAG: asparagine synthase (glutamine-hydrolyzing) [Lachnospiraceae bacterium]|nr:asparagine synthase (glutamine-hydrolyzing) [Lachnospiraceae bacterium]